MWRFSCNCYVVHVYSNVSAQWVVFRDGGAENIIHECLERGGRVTETKVHHRWFEEPSAGFERRFMFISCFDLDVVIPLSYVEFCVDIRVSEISYEISNQGKRVLVLYGPLVQFPIVLYGA
jgi:hypothetical protein